MNIQEYFQENYSEDIQLMQKWVDDMYASTCGNAFEGVRALHKKLNSTSDPITDQDLEWILVSLPLELVQISEALNQLRLKSEFVKLKNKRMKSEAMHAIIKDGGDVKFDSVEGDIVSEAFAAVIRRVENEISFSRELIMGAKKIWDARRRTENVNPSGMVVPSEPVPQYAPPTSGKTYVR